MFDVNSDDIQRVLGEYGVTARVRGAEELVRYRYDEESGQARLILKCTLDGGDALIVKFKNEDGVTRELIEAQSRFSEHLAENGVPTAEFLRAGDAIAIQRELNGFRVCVTAERFRDGEIKIIDGDIAEKTGALLARTHNIAQRDDMHVDCPVIFDIFADWNDLFSFSLFEELRGKFEGEDAARFERILSNYRRRMAALDSLRGRRRYAVQGDISQCNLFMTADGEIGMFDFNRCGDNVLFCDAIMQAVFEARLMDCDRELTDEYSRELLRRFLRGYHSVRPFTAGERALIPQLTAVINAFWLSDIYYGENSLTKLAERGDTAAAGGMLRRMERIISEDVELDF